MNWAVVEPLERHLRMYYGIGADDVEPTDTPGYWRIKKVCGGKEGGCTHPLHGALFNDGPCHHTIAFRDKQRVNGRFAGAYQTWDLHRTMLGMDVSPMPRGRTIGVDVSRWMA
jgi:hypothetical protein